MRKDVTFDSLGLKCRGWLYLPDDIEANEKVPTIVMAHGFSAVKEQVLPEFAERFVDAGFAVLVFDYRYFGDSEGEPRCQLFPLEMVEDYRNAITGVCEQPHVDPARLGVWGTSYSGGLVAYVGTFDRRVRAVVAQVPSLTNAESRRAMDSDKWDSVGEFLLQDSDRTLYDGNCQLYESSRARGGTLYFTGEGDVRRLHGAQRCRAELA